MEMDEISKALVSIFTHRVCPDCGGYEGEIFTVDEAEGIIPLHPNCRCCWIPSEVQ